MDKDILIWKNNDDVNWEGKLKIQELIELLTIIKDQGYIDIELTYENMMFDDSHDGNFEICTVAKLKVS